jgi:hypothetical protein
VVPGDKNAGIPCFMNTQFMNFLYNEVCCFVPVFHLTSLIFAAVNNVCLKVTQLLYVKHGDIFLIYEFSPSSFHEMNHIHRLRDTYITSTIG